MLANGARRRLADMVKGSCGEGGMNTAAAIHNDVLSDSCRDDGILSLDGQGKEGYTLSTRLEHVDPWPIEALDEEHDGVKADRDSNTRGQHSQPARKGIGKSDRGRIDQGVLEMENGVVLDTNRLDSLT